MAYRAGSAFIAVSPDFKGWQTKLAAHAKTMRAVKVPVELDMRRTVLTPPKPVKVKVDVDADTTKAEEKIRQTTARPRRTTVGVDADTGAAHAKLTALQNRLRAMATGRTLIQVGVVAAPLAIPAVAGLVGGGAALGGIATAVGVGAGAAAAVGLSQLTKARELQKELKAATDQRKTAVEGVRSAEDALDAAQRSAGRTQLASTRAIADATRAVADARRNAARVARDSALRVVAAQRTLAEAQERVQDAEEGLHEARTQAVRDLADLTARVRENANAQEAADLSLIAAKERLALAEENIFTSATDMRAARLQVADAEAKVAETRRQGQRDAEDLAKIEREGIDGTAGVQAAKEQLARAKEDRARAQTELVQARVSAQEARADAARQVADAERNLGRARVDAATAQADAARQVADAQAGLADAQADLAAAERSRLGLLEKLTPAQKRMLVALASLQTAWSGFLRLVDRPLGGAMVSAMGALEKALPGLAIFLRPVLRSLRGVFGMLGNAAGSKNARRFARDMGVFAGGILKDAGRGTRNLVAGFGSLLRAFMPLSKDMSKGLVGLTRRFRVWARDLDESKGFKRFIAYVRTAGPKLLGTLKAVGGALIAVGVALAPLADRLMDGLRAFAGWLQKTAEAHPQLIRIVAAVFLLSSGFGLVVKMLLPVIRLVTGVVRVVMFAVKWIRIIVFNLRILFFVLRANPIGMVITIIALLVAGFILAYKKSDTFRKIVDKAWAGIKTAISWAWNRVIKPVFKALWEFLQVTLFRAFKALWTDVVRPVFTWVGNKIKDVWSNVIKPTFTKLRDFVTDTLPGAFRGAVDAIGRAWDGLQGIAAKPINFVIGTVYNNGIRAAFNKVAGFLGVETRLPYISQVGSGTTSAPARRSAGLQEYGGAGPLPTRARMPAMAPRRTAAAGGPLDWLGRIGSKAGGWVKDKFTGMVGGLLAKVGDSPWAQLAGASARRLSTVAMDHLGPKLSARSKAAVNGAPLGAPGPAGRVLPAGAYSIGMPWLGYPGHYGADYPAATGTPVFSPWPGRVVASYDLPGSNRYNNTPYRSYGRVVKVDHDNGISTLYAHLSSRIAGLGRVGAGTMIGRVGMNGNATGSHLHLEASRAGTKFNPAQLALFDGGGVLKQGMLAYHGARKPDRVLTDSQWRDIHAAATKTGRDSVFELHDVDGQLIGRMRGEARRVVAGDRDFASAQAGAGMGGRS